ncbi:hypothetical protein BABINDRAFT_162951 [Babjeviella inositovora NRRL Y-12698]|uniref:NOT2/NOT3/NOT5 C-terminal domain-containing protein n=1 Tax=Babjeviella inositovora NRRL Y-12698 TaxID=984486 RepID=A0A1E3QLG4_9ASCO|nr:uncharacterized protein BABINDRAFT_162951 [Babjeviella inositovora NRRL Y-12698]ODQ78304.1 hypothetical protein BABINDRAFT_162951 [Babjeviella inositovora NRRL Y-12698]
MASHPAMALNGASGILPPGLAASTSHTTNHSLTGSENSDEEADDDDDDEDESQFTDIDRYGLRALSSVIKMRQTDQTQVVIGSDLALLGLDLTQPNQKLSKTFASPWVETSRAEVEPPFKVPASFGISSLNLPAPDQTISTYTDETLFFIFYTKPKDLLQEMAARELIARNWRYHKDLQVWLTKSSDSEPVPINGGCERGVYIFFDPHNWMKIKKEFMLFYHAIM